MKVWVWADVTPDGPAPSALELLTKARDHDPEDAGTFPVDQLVDAASVGDYEILPAH